ncbi:CoA pyrophosphatase [Jeotgalibacillus sp. ET6]|uniref:NUDIX hydrolase n=1 Tax=Jeotgalibacillus sp. ET6 TaxID=3037260 RepID=UPI002418950C|nr:CoA pyrophosphatase [Jeotgalibacillus sp. ET6]MDG5472525.1 CoA pyrophosphatase [Jeotgalibacillus sp. ET6]
MDQQVIMKKMASRQPSIIGEESMRKYAILLPFIKKDGELHLLFEVRAQSMRRQPGEVCFPGGRVDASDKGPLEAAVREAEEELGVVNRDIENVSSFGTLVSPFGMTIYSYIGFIKHDAAVKINPAEVDEIFTVPLSYFLTNAPSFHPISVEVKPEEGFPYDLIANGREYKWQARQYNEYFYHVEGHVIWGLTARVLKEFIEVLKKE